MSQRETGELSESAATGAIERAGRQYRGQSPDARRADRRKRLLGAGLELYGTNGYSPTTITDICRKAGVAPSHFYEEFPTRESLLAALYEEIVSSTRTVVSAAMDASPLDMETRCRKGLYAYCHELLDDPRVAKVICAEVVGVSAEMEMMRSGGLEVFADMMIEQFLATANGAEALGPLPDTHYLKSVAVTLVGGANEAMLDWLLDENRLPVDELIEIFVGTFLATAQWVIKTSVQRREASLRPDPLQTP